MNRRLVSPIETAGLHFINLVVFFGTLSILTVSSFRKIFERGRTRAAVIRYVEEIGIASLPLVGIIAVFTGMVLVMETVTTLKKFGAENYAGGIVGVSMIRELGPVLIALVIAGRVGASIAAELGTMKITEQIDALEVLAVDPVSHLVSPRLLAAFIAFPCLLILSFFLALSGAFFIGVNLVGMSSGTFWFQSFRFVVMKDLFVGMTKALVFSSIIINVSAMEGFRATGGAEGVGKAAMLAVVNAFFLIILMNLIITAICYFL